MKTKILTLVIFILLPNIISAQIKDIKIKSQNNSSSSSSSSIDFGGSGDIAGDIVGCCVSNVFSMLIDGCLTGILSNTNKNIKPDIEVDTDDYYYEEPMPKKNEYENASDETIHINSTEKHTDDGDIEYENIKDYYFEVKALFDISGHKGIDKNYLHMDYLPGIQASWQFFVLDFRYNVLTQLNTNDIDAFKSWELLFAINFSARQRYRIILGTGVHQEQFQQGNSFNEFIASFKIPVNLSNSIDISSRFSIDYETEVFPFFEINTRYNHRLFSIRDAHTYLTLGLTYQNYYESYDILGLRTGIIISF